MTKITKCYAKKLKKSRFLCFNQSGNAEFVSSDNKKVCTAEAVHTEKCRAPVATTQNRSLPTSEDAK